MELLTEGIRSTGEHDRELLLALHLDAEYDDAPFFGRHGVEYAKRQFISAVVELHVFVVQLLVRII